MKNMKKLLALVLSVIMMMAVSVTAFAADTPSITIKPNNSSDVTTSPTITYTYYKILSADIDTDPTVGLDGATTAHGVAAYYVENEAQATALSSTGVFTVTRVGTTNKWYVELVDGKTADDIITAFNNDTFLANFTKQEYTSEGSDAILPGVSKGYYFIKSSLGSKMALQTLSPVTINEKNQYVTDDKTIPAVDEHSQIGQEITYTLTVNVPATATEQIVLTDTMGKGLTFKEIKSQTPIAGTASAVSAAADDATKFTITYTADQVKALVAGGSDAVITVEVTVIVNDQAAIDTAIPNTLNLKYGNNYEAKPVTVNTETTKFDFDKVDGTDKTIKLTGAEFQLLQGSTVIKLVEVESGKTYRVATADEIATGATVEKIVTNGNTITINGLDGDLTYQLKETKAPTGYNIMSPDTVDVAPNTSKKFDHRDVENNKGTELPSTGGIGTTIFYVAGIVMVLGAAVVLISRRKAEAED